MTEQKAYRLAAENRITIAEALDILKDQWLLGELVVTKEKA